MKNAYVIIDGAYLSLLCKYFGNGKYLRLNIKKFSEYLCKKEKINCEKIFYYTAPPYQSYNPNTEETNRKKGYDSFISKLKNNSVIIREGRLQKIDNKYYQKGVDTLITIDLMDISLNKKADLIMLISCDTDFVPVLEKIRNDYGMKIILYYFTDKIRNSRFSLSNHLLISCDKCVLFNKEDFKQFS
ncbi:MAG: NYN domain-containing protein [Nanoarchaeota archaeon]